MGQVFKGLRLRVRIVYDHLTTELMPLAKGNMSDEEMLRLLQRRVDDEIARRE